MLNNPTVVSPLDFINASATATGVLFSIPAGRYFSMEIQLSGTQSGVGTATPNVVFTAAGAGFSPASGSVVARLSITGLLGVTSAAADTIEFSGYSGDTGATLTFNNSGTSSCVMNGFLL